jgi:hypothetical protein
MGIKIPGCVLCDFPKNVLVANNELAFAIESD